MKTKFNYWLHAMFASGLMLAFFTVTAVSAFAQTAAGNQTAAATAPDPLGGLVMFIPILTPLLVALLKLAADKLVEKEIPGWVLPLLCPVLGVLLTYLNGLAGGSGDLWHGALLGAAGSFVREFVDQAKQRAGTPPTAGGVGGAAALFVVGLLTLGMAGGMTGCATSLQTGGVYQGDLALYRTDMAVKTAYDALNAFESWEYANRAVLFAKNPKIKAEADTIRVNAPRWFESEATLRAAYVANPTPGNLTSLQAVLSEIQAALTVASQYLSTSTSN